MNLGAFLAGFGPGILNAQQKIAQQRAEDQRLQLLGLEARARIRQMQDEGDTVKGFNAAMDDLQGGGSAPPPLPGGGMAAPGGISGGAPGGGLQAGGALTGTGLGHVAPKADRVAFARDYAASKNLNPDAIVATFAGEGLNKYVGDGGTSFGDPQLHVGGGMGDEALRAGINIRDPNTWREQTKFAIDQMAANRDKGAGWFAGQWHGAPAWAARSFNQPTTTANAAPAAAGGQVGAAGGDFVEMRDRGGTYRVPRKQYEQLEAGGYHYPGAPTAGAPKAAGGDTDQSAPRLGGTYRVSPQQFGQIEAGAPKAAGADPANADARRVAQVTAPTIDPSLAGKMSPEGIARSIEKAIPNASPKAKHDAIMEMSKFLSPWMRQQWEERRDQTQRQQQLEDAEKRRREHLADQEHSDQRDDIKDERSEKHFKEHKEYDAEHPNYQPQEFLDEKGNVQWVRPGQPVSPGWHRAPAGSGVGGRDADIAREIKRLDTAYAKEHPQATTDEIEAAHFQHRKRVDQAESGAKAAPSRTMTSAIARAYLENHPEATADDLIKLNGSIRREASIQTAFAGGEAGRQVRSLNTLADHIALTREYGEAIGNGQFPRASAALNRWSIETGHPEVNDFKAARDIMAGEFVKLLTSTGGTEADRTGMRALFAESASPEQMAGALNVATRFVGGRLTGLQQQYARNDPKRIEEFRGELLSSGSREIFLSSIPRASETQQLPPGMAIQPQQLQSGAQPQAGQQQQQRQRYDVGAIIEHGGKRYRVIGGDPYDPELEEVR